MEYNSEIPTYVDNRRNGCFYDSLKIGCGFIAGVFCTILFISIIFYASGYRTAANIEKHDDFSLYSETDEEIQYFQVKSKKGSATIHTGMSKDSVILLLGQPTEFMSSGYIDQITYQYGKYDLNSLTIMFEKGKVTSVYQF